MKPRHVVINPRWAAQAVAWSALLAMTVSLALLFQSLVRMHWWHKHRWNHRLPVTPLPVRLSQTAMMCAHVSWPVCALPLSCHIQADNQSAAAVIRSPSGGGSHRRADTDDAAGTVCAYFPKPAMMRT
jgi:hypothetical protein